MRNRLRPGMITAAFVALALAAGGPVQAQHGEGGRDVGAGDRVGQAVPASARWNEIARQVAAADQPHGGAGAVAMGGRTLALVSLAQLAAAEAVEAAEAPVAVATASATLLAELFPSSRSLIDEQVEVDRASAGGGGSLVDAEAAGREAAATVLRWSSTDGHDARWTGILQAGPDRWVSAAAVEPVGAHWGAVRPWLVESPEEFRPAAPPAPGSAEFAEALDEVRRATRGRSAEFTALAEKWMAPVDGYWNEVATDLITRAGMSEVESARVLTMVNAAVVDAVITCFDTKYHFQFPRPSHVDETISMAVPLPNHPSYVSGHACVSGAASAVLSDVFPAREAELTALADEIALSRLYAGVHYRFDNDAGLAVGRAIGKKAVEMNPTSAKLLAR